MQKEKPGREVREYDVSGNGLTARENSKSKMGVFLDHFAFNIL